MIWLYAAVLAVTLIMAYRELRQNGHTAKLEAWLLRLDDRMKKDGECQHTGDDKECAACYAAWTATDGLADELLGDWEMDDETAQMLRDTPGVLVDPGVTYADKLYRQEEVCICLMSEGFHPEPPQSGHNSWCTYKEVTDES